MSEKLDCEEDDRAPTNDELTAMLGKAIVDEDASDPEADWLAYDTPTLLDTIAGTDDPMPEATTPDNKEDNIWLVDASCETPPDE